MFPPVSRSNFNAFQKGFWTQVCNKAAILRLLGWLHDFFHFPRKSHKKHVVTWGFATNSIQTWTHWLTLRRFWRRENLYIQRRFAQNKGCGRGLFANCPISRLVELPTVPWIPKWFVKWSFAIYQIRLQAGTRRTWKTFSTKTYRRSHKLPPVWRPLMPWKSNSWKLKFTQLKRKIIFQTSSLEFRVNFPGCCGIDLSWVSV